MEFVVFLAMFLIMLIIGHRIGYRAGINSDPIERPWGDGKDLTGLLPLSDSKLRELEAWYAGSQTKDAQIKALESQLRVAESTASRLRDLAVNMRRQSELPSGLKPVPYVPGGVVVLPNDVTYMLDGRTYTLPKVPKRQSYLDDIWAETEWL